MDEEYRRFLQVIAEGNGAIKPSDRGNVYPYISKRIWKTAKDLYPDTISQKLESMLANLILHHDREQSQTGSTIPLKKRQ